MKVNLLRSVALISLIVFTLTGSKLSAQTAANETITGPALSKESLIGKWKAAGEEYTLRADGTSLIKTDGRECPGTWELRGRTLIINPKKLMYKKDDQCSTPMALRVINIIGTDLHLFEKSKKKEFHLAKQNTKDTE